MLSSAFYINIKGDFVKVFFFFIPPISKTFLQMSCIPVLLMGRLSRLKMIKSTPQQDWANLHVVRLCKGSSNMFSLHFRYKSKSFFLKTLVKEKYFIGIIIYSRSILIFTLRSSSLAYKAILFCFNPLSRTEEKCTFVTRNNIPQNFVNWKYTPY